MSKSQYIHAPSLEEFSKCVSEARFIAYQLRIARPPELKVTLPVMESSHPSRETAVKASHLHHELKFMARVWTALRFDAATQLNMAVIHRAYESLKEGFALGATADRVQVQICNLTECVLDANHVYECALTQGRTFFTKVLPGLGKVLDSTYPHGITDDTFLHVPFHSEAYTIKTPNEEYWASDGQDYRIPRFMRALFVTFLSQALLDPDTTCVVSTLWSDHSTRKGATDWVRYEASMKTKHPLLYEGIQALKSLRQLCFLYYKLETPFEAQTVRDISDSFCTVDASLPIGYMVDMDWVARFKHNEDSQYSRFVERHLELHHRTKTPQGDSSPGRGLEGIECFSASSYEAHLLHVARYVVRRVLGPVDPRNIQGRHGPGAVATGEKGPNKATFKRLYRKLEQMYPFTEYFCYNMTHVSDDLESIQTRLTEMDEATAKVVFVPKDSRGPRMISCEPLEIQWIQQGLMRLMTETIKANPLTHGKVMFDDQSKNQDLARGASAFGPRAATIDLKDASDRVSVALVESLFPQPWVEALLAARSDNTKLPDGRIVELRKFAPMGSATCFPVEALCFFALSAAAAYLEDVRPTYVGRTNTRILGSALKKAVSSITVFGDDIIINIDNCDVTIAALERFHLKVNVSKSYQAGLFRESCGIDAFAGINVTPIRIKRIWNGQSLPTQDALISYVAQSNALLAKGYAWAAWEVERRLQMVLADHEQMLIPYTMRANPPGLAFIRAHRGLYWTPVKEKVRYNRRHDRKEVLTYVVEGVVKRSQRLGWEEMVRCEAYRSPHLQFGINPNCWRAGVYAIPRCYKVTKRWMPYSQE